MIGNDTTDGWKVRFERPVWSAGVHIYLFRNRGGSFETLGSGGIITLHREGEMIAGLKPTLQLDAIDAKQMMAALAEALAEEGVKVPDTHRLEGILEAQTKHIEDLREMLKLKNTGGLTWKKQ